MVRGFVLRWLIRLTLTAACAYLLLFLTVQVRARIVRSQAEHLLGDMRSLPQDHASWQDFQRLRTRWGAWGGYYGSCTPTECHYRIDVSEYPRYPGKHSEPSSTATFFNNLAIRLLVAGHSHLGTASLYLEVRQGELQVSSFRLTTQVPTGYGPRWEREMNLAEGYTPYASGEYELIAEARTGFEPDRLCCSWPYRPPQATYEISAPDGCSNCLAVWVTYATLTPAADVARLTDFNLNCFTRWRPCVDEEDIAPAAGREKALAQQRSKIRDSQVNACSFPLQDSARASRNGVVVRVGNTARSNSVAPFLDVTLQVRLGGSTSWKAGTVRQLDGNLAPALQKVLQHALQTNREVIALFPNDGDGRHLEPYTCGLVPDSPENRALVAKALALGEGRLEPH